MLPEALSNPPQQISHKGVITGKGTWYNVPAHENVSHTASLQAQSLQNALALLVAMIVCNGLSSRRIRGCI